MATKKTIKMASATDIFREELETPQGVLIISANKNTALSDIERYEQKLCHGRGIPFDLDNISQKDPRFGIVSKLPWLKSFRAQKEYLRRYYEVEQAKAHTEGGFLMMFADPQNVLTVEPKPYMPDPILPGMEDDLQPIQRNLTIPLERRLKQIYDIIEDPVIYNKVFAMMGRIADQLEGEGLVEVDEDGFQSQSTG